MDNGGWRQPKPQVNKTMNKVFQQYMEFEGNGSGNQNTANPATQNNNYPDQMQPNNPMPDPFSQGFYPQMKGIN